MLTWKEEWDLGIKPIDLQHRNILKAINFICDWACNQQGGKQEMDKVIRALEAYACKHFSYEEGLLQKVGFPQFAAHQREHQLFVKKVHQLKGHLAAAQELDDFAFEVVSFLQAWLKQHILQHDAEYAPLVRAYLINRKLDRQQAAQALSAQANP